MDDNCDEWKKDQKGYFAIAIICFIPGTHSFIKVATENSKNLNDKFIFLKFDSITKMFNF